MDAHEAADIYPLDEVNIPSLAEDIRANGLLDPIELFDGKIIDGRRRFRACQMAGVQPVFNDVVISDPIAHVMSKQNRRDLTASQRSMAAVKAGNLRERLEREAQERHRLSTSRAGKASGSVRRGELNAVAMSPPRSGTKTRDQLAELAGVGSRTIECATRVLKHGAPELIQAVEQGRMSVNRAADLVVEPAAVQVAEAEQAERVRTPRLVSKAKDVEPNEVSPEEAERIQKQKGRAVEAAHEAINCLMKIRRDNPGRDRAFQMVRDWMKNNS